MGHKTHYDNNFPDFISFEWSEELVNNLIERKRFLINRLLESPASKEDGIYEGNGGACVLLLKLYAYSSNLDEKQKYLQIAIFILEKILKKQLHENITFLLGNAGIYALAAVASSCAGNYAKMKHYTTKLILISEDAEPLNTHELLVGWAGYLHALLYVYNYTRNGTLLLKAEEIVYTIMTAGRQTPFKTSPIMFEWLRAKYIGFAHGFAGIIYMIMKVYELSENHKQEKYLDPPTWDKILEDIKACLDFLISTTLPSGNYPPTIDENFDQMVQWCHGAPGVVLTFCKAYEVFKLSRFQEAAQRGCEITWTRGLIKKGLGLCHGISGNAYAFLAMYRVTKDKRYLYYATKFADFGWDNKEILDSLIAAPDNPNSLFEGIGGAIYFYNDLIYLSSHSLFMPDFPTFECNN